LVRSAAATRRDAAALVCNTTATRRNSVALVRSAVVTRSDAATLAGSATATRGNVATLARNTVATRGDVAALAGNATTTRGNVATLARNALQLATMLQRWPTMRCNLRRCCSAGRQRVAARNTVAASQGYCNGR
jgi:alkylated DNA nucleotide flippase Atl1